MNALFSKQITFGGLRRITVLGCCMALLLTSIHLARGGTGFTLNPGTNIFNFYAYNGTSLTADGIDPEAMFSGAAAPLFSVFSPTAFQGTIFPVGQQSVTSVVISGGANFADVIFLLGSKTATSGANPTGLSPSGQIGLTLQLNNPNSAPDEVRFDWNAVYTYSGSSTTLGSASAPLAVIISGFLSSVGSFYALAGGETLTDGSSSTTATLGAGTAPGDGFTNPSLGTGPWNGGGSASSSSTFYINIPTAPFSSGGLNVINNDTVSVTGYLDLVVDPGSIQVQLGSLLPPQLGITTYSNFPVVFFPSNPGTNFVLQTTSDLTSSNWVPVTNGIPISGLIITNATSPAFFRLN